MLISLAIFFFSCPCSASLSVSVSPSLMCILSYTYLLQVSPCCCSSVSVLTSPFIGADMSNRLALSVARWASLPHSLSPSITIFVYCQILDGLFHSLSITVLSLPLVALFPPASRKICSLIGPDYLPSVCLCLMAPLLCSDSTFAHLTTNFVLSFVFGITQTNKS
jgi:hypothetical protein